MQIRQPIKSYTLRSGRTLRPGRHHTPIQPPIKPAQTNNTTNGEKNGDKGNGDKENVTPGKPAEVLTQKKKVVKPVRDSKVPTKPVRQGNVASVGQKRKVVSDSNVLTELVQQSVAIVSRKRKVVSDSNVLTELVQQGIVASVGWKRKVVSDSHVQTEPVQQSVAIVSRKRKVVSDSNVLTEPVQQGIVASVGRKRKVVSDSNVPTEPVQQGIVASVGRKRKVVSDSNVLTEPVQQGIVASVGRKRKVVSDSNVLTEPVQQGIVPSVGRKRKVVSDSNVLTEPVQQGIVASVGRKRKAKPVTADYGGSIAEVKTRKRLGVVQTDDVISNVKTGCVSKKINKPTLVPSAVIPSISDDYSQFSQSLDEEKAYQEQLAASQKSGSGKGKGKGKGKVKKDLPKGVTIFCTKCHEVFDDADQLSVHEKNCFIGRRYPCPYAGCSHVNSQNSLLEEHIKGVHKNNPFRCELCPQEVFIYKKSYNKHFKSYHQSGPQNRNKFKYVCEDCDFVSDDRTEYQTHVDRHRNMKRYKCNVCGSAYFTQPQLTHHFKNSCSSVVDANKYECSVCGKHLKSEDRYREHFYSQHVLDQPEKMYYCEVCICRFFLKGDFNYMDAMVALKSELCTLLKYFSLF